MVWASVYQLEIVEEIGLGGGEEAEGDRGAMRLQHGRCGRERTEERQKAPHSPSRCSSPTLRPTSRSVD